MKLIEKEIELPMDMEVSHQLRSEIMDLQNKSNQINQRIESLLMELTKGVNKKKVQVVEEEYNGKIIGWYSGKIIYEREITDNDRQLEMKVEQPKEDKPSISSEPLQQDSHPETAEGPIFVPDSEEPESLI